MKASTKKKFSMFGKKVVAGSKVAYGGFKKTAGQIEPLGGFRKIEADQKMVQASQGGIRPFGGFQDVSGHGQGHYGELGRKSHMEVQPFGGFDRYNPKTGVAGTQIRKQRSGGLNIPNPGGGYISDAPEHSGRRHKRKHHKGHGGKGKTITIHVQ